MPCTISKNGLGIKTRTLIDTGANGYIFIDQKLAEKASQYLDTPITALPVSHDVRAFNGHRASPITHYIELNLHIDGRKQVKQPMVLVQLGGHDMIIGRAWAEKHNTLVDCQNRQLLWPDEPAPTKGWNKVITTHQRNLFPPVNKVHQADAQRRDCQIEKDIWKPQCIVRRTWRADQRTDYQRMEQEL
jgi:predicted aspartyl protease